MPNPTDPFSPDAAPDAQLQDAAATATPRVFDAGKLDELRTVMEQGAFVGLVGQFAESLQSRINRLQGWLAQANWPDAAREAHDIVSVAGNIGAEHLSTLARAIEKSCKASNAAGCSALGATFTTAAADAMRALKTYQAAA